MSDRSAAQRGRQTPEASESEILDAAEGLLRERPVGKLTIGAVMGRTRLGRSSFYVHFKDVYDLVARLLQRLESELWRASQPWLEDGADPREAIIASVSGVVDVWVEHGPVLAAVAQASMTDDRVHRMWRRGVFERFIDVIDERLAVDTASPASALDSDGRRRLAAALLLMNERYLIDTVAAQPPDDAEPVRATLTSIWSRALYPAAEL